MTLANTPLPGAGRSDLARFAGLIETALTAFATDDRYAVAMARRAVQIQRNRVLRAELAHRRQERSSIVDDKGSDTERFGRKTANSSDVSAGHGFVVRQL